MLDATSRPHSLRVTASCSREPQMCESTQFRQESKINPEHAIELLTPHYVEGRSLLAGGRADSPDEMRFPRQKFHRITGLEEVKESPSTTAVVRIGARTRHVEVLDSDVDQDNCHDLRASNGSACRNP